jgi:N-acetylglucosaminyl-diphospho-decaprenol L-rhamnosyltransferase
MKIFDLSIIIVNWNTRDLVIRCLQSIYETVDSLAFEVIVVDNASTDDSIATTRELFPQVQIIENRENVGFARANNQAAAVSQGRYMLLLNSDALLLPHAARKMFDLAEAHPQAGIVGAQLFNPDGSFQASHTPFPNLWQEFLILSGVGRLLFGHWYPSRGPEDDKGPQIAGYVEGACLFVRRAAFEQVGGLDENYFMYAEEVDWCYTMQKKGWRVWYEPAAQVIHLGCGSSQTRRTQREGDLYQSRVRFFRKHYGNTAAQLLKLQIYCFTLIKAAVHSPLRLVSGGRRGRQVVPLSCLISKLKEA